MTQQERIEEIANSSFGIQESELRSENNQTHGYNFSSIEYYFILHLTNEELYYMDDETLSLYQDAADYYEDTAKGKIFLMK